MSMSVFEFLIAHTVDSFQVRHKILSALCLLVYPDFANIKITQRSGLRHNRQQRRADDDQGLIDYHLMMGRFALKGRAYNDNNISKDFLYRA